MTDTAHEHGEKRRTKPSETPAKCLVSQAPREAR